MMDMVQVETRKQVPAQMVGQLPIVLTFEEMATLRAAAEADAPLRKVLQRFQFVIQVLPEIE